METTPTQLQVLGSAAGPRHRAVHLNIRGFYFRGSKAIRENRESLHHAKVSRYTVIISNKECGSLRLPIAYNIISFVYLLHERLLLVPLFNNAILYS